MADMFTGHYPFIIMIIWVNSRDRGFKIISFFGGGESHPQFVPVRLFPFSLNTNF